MTVCSFVLVAGKRHCRSDLVSPRRPRLLGKERSQYIGSPQPYTMCRRPYASLLDVGTQSVGSMETINQLLPQLLRALHVFVSTIAVGHHADMKCSHAYSYGSDSSNVSAQQLPQLLERQGHHNNVNI